MDIKRIQNALKADIMFQFKHGFYYIYIVLALMYIFIFSLMDDSITKFVLPILVYLDPSVLGLFFIGGMVLLEKEQGILSLLYVTPLNVTEYIVSKVVSLAVLSMIAGWVISILSYGGQVNYFYLFFGILLAAVFFTLLGFLLSSRVKNVNEYIVKMIPWMMLMIIPCFSLIPNNFVPNVVNLILNIVPSVAGLKIVMGAYTASVPYEIVICFASLIIFNILLINKVTKVMTNNVILNS